MLGLSSLDFSRQIKKARPQTKVVFLSMYAGEDYPRESLETEASGYVLKDTAAPELIAAICEAARGGSYLSLRLMTRLGEELRGRIKSPAQVSQCGKERC